MKNISEMVYKISTYHFVFSELIKRDFKKKYKRSVLGIFWSMLAPLFSLLVMNFIFSSFFGRTGEHYIIYLFSGIVVMTYFSQSTNTGMGALVGNASIFSKVNVPKYLFVFSSVASASINFSLTLILFFVFVFLNGLSFHFKFFFLIFPIICLMLLSLGVAMILSAMNVFFKDIVYLYGVFMTALTYATPIFYPTSILGDRQYLFMFNPLFLVINYIREIVIYNRIPDFAYHAVTLSYCMVFLLVGFAVYKKYNYRFLYYA